MINHLTRIIVETNENGLQVSRLPDSEEIMKKINEMVNVINSQQKQINNLYAWKEQEKINKLFEPNPFMPNNL